MQCYIQGLINNFLVTFFFFQYGPSAMCTTFAQSDHRYYIFFIKVTVTTTGMLSLLLDNSNSGGTTAYNLCC